MEQVTGDVHDGVADSDDADSVLVVTGVASGNESSNNTIVTNGTGVGSSVSGTYGSLNIAANGTYTYTANATNNIALVLLQPILLRLLPVMMKRTQAHLVMMLEPLLLQLQVQFL